MLPPELSLCSPLPPPLAMNNSPPEGPMRFVKMVFLVNAGCAGASARAPSSRKNAVTVIPNFFMENLPSDARIVRLSCPRHNEFATNLLREQATRDQRGSDGSFFPSDLAPFSVPSPGKFLRRNEKCWGSAKDC